MIAPQTAVHQKWLMSRPQPPVTWSVSHAVIHSINALITITPEQALAAAREIEAEQRAGKWRGPLHGIPIALKDNIDTAGIRTTAASGVFKDRVPMEDAEVATRLKKAGAILIGKLNLHEFAWRNLRSHLLWSGTQPVGIRPRAGRIIRRNTSAPIAKLTAATMTRHKTNGTPH